MTRISHFCIKPLVLSRLKCTEHAEWPTWGNPPPSNQRQKSGDVVFSSPGVMFVFVFFPKALTVMSHACTPSFGY